MNVGGALCRALVALCRVKGKKLFTTEVTEVTEEVIKSKNS
ncbi:hypothetical protein PTET_a0507 [Pseudoalteromonas tetraodonis]|nr:hypothetical protein PTET_a0507 [Pseudoalteromonas tetraodonis]